uniref:Uncharacterized protein n=1 Tax=Rhizophora mucronata TaxID=61149 RepID=A0A2P2JG45_RHIMU
MLQLIQPDNTNLKFQIDRPKNGSYIKL